MEVKKGEDKAREGMGHLSRNLTKILNTPLCILLSTCQQHSSVVYS